LGCASLAAASVAEPNSANSQNYCLNATHPPSLAGTVKLPASKSQQNQ